MTGNKPASRKPDNNVFPQTREHIYEQVVISGRFGVEVTSGRQKIWNEQVGRCRTMCRVSGMLGSSEGRDRILGISAPSLWGGSHGKREILVKGERCATFSWREKGRYFQFVETGIHGKLEHRKIAKKPVHYICSKNPKIPSKGITISTFARKIHLPFLPNESNYFISIKSWKLWKSEKLFPSKTSTASHIRIHIHFEKFS